MKKGTKIALWTSIPLVLLIWFAGPRLGLWGNRDLKKSDAVQGTVAPAQGQAGHSGQGQRPETQQGQGQRPEAQQVRVSALADRDSFRLQGRSRSLHTLQTV
jgi:hypothetical protein